MMKYSSQLSRLNIKELEHLLTQTRTQIAHLKSKSTQLNDVKAKRLRDEMEIMARKAGISTTEFQSIYG